MFQKRTRKRMKVRRRWKEAEDVQDVQVREKHNPVALIYQRGADQNLGVHRNLGKSRHLSFQLDFDFGLG